MLLFTSEEQILIDSALKLLETKLLNDNVPITDSSHVKKYLTIKLRAAEKEMFGVMYLDSQNRIITDKVLFQGTINATVVYPREIAKEALLVNAKSVILYHNHPSGINEPSESDELITGLIVECLKLFNIDVLDHFIVGRTVFSFAENKLI